MQADSFQKTEKEIQQLVSKYKSKQKEIKKAKAAINDQIQEEGSIF